VFSTRNGAARLSLIVILGLVAVKVAVAIITGSLSLLAQGIDSSLDLLAVTITLIAVRFAIKPADQEHPFGHGKLENVAAIVQGILVLAAGGAIIVSAIQRIITGTTVELTEAGIGVMLVSIVASIFLSRHLLRVARTEDSAALEANAHNIAVDVYSATAVLVGLALIYFTGFSIIDPIIALLVALFILKVAYDIFRRSFSELIDVKLPEDEEEIIRESITEHSTELVEFHKLRTRKSGNQRYIDLHMVMPSNASVEEAHQLADHLESDIRTKLSRAHVTIHIEPCDGECEQCPIPTTECKERYGL